MARCTYPKVAVCVLTAAAAACTSESPIEAAQPVAAAAAVATEVVPMYLQFDAEKRKASAADLPDQF